MVPPWCSAVGSSGGSVVPEAVVQAPASMCNRHGLIAGATGTGTGRTKTLQLMAEQLSGMGVAVFVADIKGDLTGLLKPGEPDDKVAAHVGAFLKSREGRAAVNNVVRGAFGVLEGFMK